jgi:hypothetical protein
VGIPDHHEWNAWKPEAFVEAPLVGGHTGIAKAATTEDAIAVMGQ